MDREQELKNKIALAGQELSNLQEEALMLVPQHLLSKVNGGTTQDFKNVLVSLQQETDMDLQAFAQQLQGSQKALDEAEAAILSSKPTQKP